MAHMHYKGTGKMHSFRGLLADGAQERIRIQGATGDIAWRITKFELIPYNPASQSSENTIGIWRDKTSADAATKYINFTLADLLAGGYIQNGASNAEAMTVTIIFDNTLFTRNIYITNSVGDVASEGINYYIELEEVKVSAAGMAQLSVAAARRSYIPGT